jgi:hypothetical protein
MKQDATVLERAFELASSGEYENVALLRKRLQYEGYTANEIDGPMLLKQLRTKISTARG